MLASIENPYCYACEYDLAQCMDIRVQHALTADGVDLKFTPRGILKRSEEGSKFEQDKLSASEAEALKALAANDGFYHVRVETHPGKNDDQYVSSLVRACTLVSSKLKDELGIHMNENGDVIALEYRPTNVTCANKFFAKKIVDGSSFKTTIKLRTRGMPGPM
ncbi:hypothetical protein SARC_12556 [Sphaeroforma arctica JP610]|uniref:ER membrane protein complex subunit 10 n=1 Tax=Sphaeroforma arctica JP610 TaxID=667725 RepID=A0A0L0FFS1_9EUKA|nr:hypothetical protein SARC_12556 [Sphaeroforma arctica JP610]KNC74908.1 hypothetical protein SARC_12556 [Sphaeroforma arctica JP610]|eukprot:XP_014148810.1 hypothetical protein SARC_12556 [Sphaeroforma arctica JP610]